VEVVMSKYLERFRAYLDDIDKTIANETNERHLTILQGYKTHACYEFGGIAHQIFTPDLTVDHPVYTVKLGRGEGDIQLFDGDASVKSFYDYVNSQLALYYNETLWVNDWGLASRGDLVLIRSGESLAAEGVEVDDPGAEYCETTHIAMFWPYDENAKLVGEHIYKLEEPTLEKVAPEDVFTAEQRNAISAEYLAGRS
jgi:hypothetical protein